MSDLLKKLEAITKAKSILRSSGVGDDIISLKCDNIEILTELHDNEKRYETICKWVRMYEKESNKEASASFYMNLIKQVINGKFKGLSKDEKINKLAATKTPFFGDDGWGGLCKVTNYEVVYDEENGGKCLMTCVGQGTYNWYPYHDYGKTWGFHLGEIDDDEVKR